MENRSWLISILGAALPLLCASGQTSTGPSPEVAPVAAVTNKDSATKLGPVVVCDFAFETSDLQADAGLIAGRKGPVKKIRARLQPEETPAQKAARLAGLLSQAIAEELEKMKIPVSRQAPGMPSPLSGLVVQGEFVQVDEGNRLKRTMIGFGSGGTEVLVQVQVFDLAQSKEQPILEYGTGRGSKRMPGALITKNPWVMSAKYVLSRNATEKDVRKLGKNIGKDLARLLAGHAEQPSHGSS